MATRHIFADPKIRDLVSRPLGEVVQENAALGCARACSGSVITVGDVVSRAFLEKGFNPDIVIFDEKTRREGSGRFPPELLTGYEIHHVSNPAGTISEEAFRQLKKLISLSGRFALKILGEEDLLGLPAIEVAPVGSLVFYGQPDRGIVLVAVDRESKRIARSILDRSRVA